MQHSHRSLPFVTSRVHRAIAGRLDDQTLLRSQSYSRRNVKKMKEKVDHGAQNMFSLMLFCAKKVIDIFQVTK